MRISLLVLVLVVALLPAAIAGAEPTQGPWDSPQHDSFSIINGQPADSGEYPGMAAIVIVDQQFQFCGGTLIAPEWVMSAAHCFYDPRTGQNQFQPAEIEVRLDTVDWTTGGERVAVEQIVVHPSYDDFTTSNDIALLRLATPALTPPSALVGAGDAALYEPGRPAVVTGYGATTPLGEDPSQILLEADVPLVGDPSCSGDYPLAPELMVCAGDPGTEQNPGNDTCQGDSGGPLWTDRGDGVLAVIGITSFGDLCGVESPGVYTEVIAYVTWIAGIMDGTIDPGTPDPTTPQNPGLVPQRITFDDSGVSDAVTQAVAISRQAFREGDATHAVIATSARFPDALAGSSLAYGQAPLLFTGPDGLLGEETLTELRRVVTGVGPIRVLGGTAAIPAAVDSQLADIGFAVQRLAGSGREETAALVAQEILAPFEGDTQVADTVILATGANWPDAVTVGEIGSWWGPPVLLTPTDLLNPVTADALRAIAPDRVLVAGGTAAIRDSVVAEVQAITGPDSTVRLAGPTRFETAAAVTQFNLDELYGVGAPQYIVGVNLRRERDAYAHVLAASMLTGRYSGVFAAIEGELGDRVPQPVLDTVCGLGLQVLIAGGPDLISDAAVNHLSDASEGIGCTPSPSGPPLPTAVGELTVGASVNGTLDAETPSQVYTFRGLGGQAIRVSMSSPFNDQGSPYLDTLIRLFGPDGTQVGEDDDGGVLTNSDLEITLPFDGTYLVEATSFSGFQEGPYTLLVDAGDQLR